MLVVWVKKTIIESGSLTLKEHEAARWLSKDQLNTVDWLPADQEVVKKLKELITNMTE